MPGHGGHTGRLCVGQEAGDGKQGQEPVLWFPLKGMAGPGGPKLASATNSIGPGTGAMPGYLVPALMCSLACYSLFGN